MSPENVGQHSNTHAGKRGNYTHQVLQAIGLN